MHLKIKPLTPKARLLYANHGKFHEGDSGLDLFVLEPIVILPGETETIKLGIACETVDSESFLLMPRSSISKTPLRMANSIGLIDSGYRGELMAVVDNVKTYTAELEQGDRLFQIVPLDGKVGITFELVDELSETTRGTGGFGSTDK